MSWSSGIYWKHFVGHRVMQCYLFVPPLEQLSARRHSLIAGVFSVNKNTQKALFPDGLEGKSQRSWIEIYKTWLLKVFCSLIFPHVEVNNDIFCLDLQRTSGIFNTYTTLINNYDWTHHHWLQHPWWRTPETFSHCFICKLSVNSMSAPFSIMSCWRIMWLLKNANKL